MKTIKKGSFVRSSSHSIAFANQGKVASLCAFIDEYRSASRQLLDFLWVNKITWADSFFDIQNDQLNIPSMLSTTTLPVSTTLSARALKCAANQVIGIILGVTKKRKKLLWLQEKGKDVEAQLAKAILTKPVLPKDFKAELNSICCQFKEVSKEFDGFLQLSSIGKGFGKIRIPLKMHRHARRLERDGAMMPSFLVSKDRIDIRWKIEAPKCQGNQVVGADQGIATVLTLSDGQATGQDRDGWTLSKIQHRLARRKKGSKGFTRAQEQRENFINWSINQLNWDKLKEVRLEKVFNLRHGRVTDRFRSHWTHSLIQRKVQSKAEELGVQVVMQSSAFRSQRCSACGWVHEGNRRQKQFCCKGCETRMDADLNASLNHSQDLPELGWSSKLSDLSKAEGFFWKPEGLFDCLGQELAVPGGQRRSGASGNEDVVKTSRKS